MKRLLSERHTEFDFFTGTNVDEARRIMSESGLAITPAAGFEDAAQKVVASLA